MKYNPALDGLRAFAVLAVIAFHAKVPGFGWGFLGVEVFFVLSGYLITSILRNGVSLRTFYLRRAARLFPALLGMLALYLLVAPIIWPGAAHGRDALLALLYLSDYSAAFTGNPKFLLHTWSLSVEEHFYLIWPFVVMGLAKVKRPAHVLLALFAMATVWRIYAGLELVNSQVYFRFDMRIAGLILGGLLAYAPKPALRWATLPVAAFVLWQYGEMPSMLLMLFAQVATAAAVMACVHGRPGLLARPIPVYLGKISYGLYLYHYPVVCALQGMGYAWPVVLLGALAVSLPLSAVSYHTIERWGSGLARRERPEGRRGEVGAVAAMTLRDANRLD